MNVNQALSTLADMEREMKGVEFEADMAGRKLNSSFALLAVQALQSYLHGEIEQAVSDWSLLVEEIQARRGITRGE